MELISNITLVYGNYSGVLNTWKIRPAETAQISYFGELIIDCGGEFTGTGDFDEITFTLPSRIVKIPSSLPIKQSFDLADTAEAAERCHVWRSTLAQRISDALEVLMAKTDATSGDLIYNLPLQDPA